MQTWSQGPAAAAVAGGAAPTSLTGQQFLLSAGFFHRFSLEDGGGQQVADEVLTSEFNRVWAAECGTRLTASSRAPRVKSRFELG